MKRNLQPSPSPISSVSGSKKLAAKRTRTGSSRKEKAVQSGLLGLCHEIAGLLLRRYEEKGDPVAVRREVRDRLVTMLSCGDERASQLIDLSLELIHVKVHGAFQRNPLELSLLIARAGNQVRELGDN